MTERVVVLGAGYAGTTAVRRLERARANLAVTWISREEYHLVLHEVHRAVRDPDVADDLVIPVAEIAGDATRFVRGEVERVDVDEQLVELAEGAPVGYDYLLVALGSRTAFYGIPGLAERALTLKSLDDALAIHEAAVGAASEATADDPARVVVGGAGLSGVQVAGELAELRDDEGLPLEVALVEAMPAILPGEDASLQRAVRRRLDSRDVEVVTDDPLVEAADDVVHFDAGEPRPYDVLVWTGGIAGQEAMDGADLRMDHNRIEADATFRTSDDRVLAVGDTALVDQDGSVAPPTAQAAWDAGEVAADNVVRAIEGRPLRPWIFRDKGTVVSIGDDAVAHDVALSPVATFGSTPAAVLKKAIAARWIRDVSSARRAASAWASL